MTSKFAKQDIRRLRRDDLHGHKAIASWTLLVLLVVPFGMTMAFVVVETIDLLFWMFDYG